MLLITDGLIWTYNTTSLKRSASDGNTTQDESQGTNSTSQGKGSFYGEELLSWASDKSLDNLPMSTKNVKAHGKVEGFILMTKDLKPVVEKYKFEWLSPDSQVRKVAAGQTIQKAFRQFKQQPKKDQPDKAQQTETSKDPDESAASPAMELV
ncbi:cyclic nucleotide-gated ion channel 1-like [Argentina anserina]|uniref:cyclic nucleotide-gated ion channel 1-like n=1 Tax=Argentina anserina TaxID=57926 RepID=UPI00217694B0|nr:cyclic nucleotide-gated ion channel 1-like [Potentilla anserina]